MRRAVLLLLAWCCVHVQALAQAAGPTPVFVLHAYSQEYPWTRGQHAGFVDALNDDVTRAYVLKVEYLDTKRVAYRADYADMMAAHLRKKYAGYRPEVIYVTDDNALAFALSHLPAMFPDTPVFFSGVNDYGIRAKLDPARATGVFERKEIAPNLRLMRQIDPDIREVVIVGDQSETYEAIAHAIRRELTRYPDIRATFVSATRIDDLVEQLRARRARFVFLTTLGAVVDATGRSLSLREVIQAIVAAGDFVVFSMEDAYLYPGVLGGYVTSGPGQGRAAAERLIHYLRGVPMTGLPPLEASPNEYILDETELLRAGLVLPADIRPRVRLVNTVPGFYETNRRIILGTLFGLAALLLLIFLSAACLYVRKNREMARASALLTETKESLDRAQRIARMGNWDWRIVEDRLFCSDGIFHLFGADPSVKGANYERFLAHVHPDDRQRVRQAMRATLKYGLPYALDHRIVCQDGSVRTVRENAEVVRDGSGRALRMSGTIQDITEQERAQQALREKDAHLEYIAYHDALTALPNRVLLMDRLHHAASRALRAGARIGVLFIDLDRFKTINDSLGHGVGDAVLEAVADRLRSVVRDEDTLSRLGGDEFVVVLESILDGHDAAVVAEKIIQALEKVIVVGNYPLHVSASIGISLYPEDGIDADTLMRHADAAMYKAKEGGRNGFHFYVQGITERAMRRVQLEARLRAASEREALSLAYQPLVCLATDRIYGAEALLRWDDPDEGPIPPDHFIPLAEDTGLIIPIGDWVIREACLALKRWQAAGVALDDFVMHVNLSGKQLLQKALPERLASLFAELAISPQWLVLELTESSILESEAVGIDILVALRQLGLRIAIDDFGTGHSSLSRLKLLPISELKIDRSFIRDIAVNKDDAAIVQAILALSANLGLTVVAEGVEHAGQEAFLIQHGCTRAQGYYYARPMPEAAMLSALTTGKRLTPSAPVAA